MLIRAAVLAAALITILAGGVVWGQTPQLQLEEVRLWEGDAPGADGQTQTDIPTLTIHRPAPGTANGAAIIIAPGGGYYIHAIDHEGLHVANELTKRGITCFMVTYRLRRDGYEASDAFVDGNRAVRFLRHHAAEYGVDPHRIGVLGFSAGGHLASALAVGYSEGDAGSDDPVERESSRPDFTVLCYAVAAGVGDQRLGRGFADKPITADTPPTFIFHTHGDEGVNPAGVLAYYQKLREFGTDAEMHIYGGYGPHGTGLGSGDPSISTWPDLLVKWMRKTGWLTDEPRLPLRGMVTIDGKPMLRGWITFTPIENDNAPIAAYYIHDPSDDDQAGRFEFTKKTGPIAGQHRVGVVHVGNEVLARPTLAAEVIYGGGGGGGDEIGGNQSLVLDLHEGMDEVVFDFNSKAGRAAD